MKALYLHSKEFFYKPVKPVGDIPKDDIEDLDREFKECIVVFLTIEDGDWERREVVIQEFSRDLLNKMKDLKVERVVVYPYAHLSENLEDPRRAFRMLKMLDRRFKELNIQYHRAPFGWYKEFRIHIYGHPLAESSRRF